MTTPPSEHAFAPPPHEFYGAGQFAPPAQAFTSGGRALARPLERLGAHILDGLLIGVPLYAVLGVVTVLAVAAVQSLDKPGPDDDGLLFLYILLAIFVGLAIVSLVSAGLSYLYVVSYQGRTGTTLGKRALKIRTVRLADGGPLDLPTARRRWLASDGAALLALIPLVGSVVGVYTWLDMLWLLWDKPLQQCLHDKYAKTIVIKLPTTDVV